MILKGSLRHKLQVPDLFIAPLPTAVCGKKRPLTELCALLGISILIANSWIRWRGILNRLSQDVSRTDFCKNLRASPYNTDLTIDTTSSWTVPDLKFTFNIYITED
jgi:hypothetical protein